MAQRLADVLLLRRLRLGREQTATASSLSDSLTLSESTHHLPHRFLLEEHFSADNYLQRSSHSTTKCHFLFVRFT
jgi:hypothetical protein